MEEKRTRDDVLFERSLLKDRIESIDREMAEIKSQPSKTGLPTMDIFRIKQLGQLRQSIQHDLSKIRKELKSFPKPTDLRVYKSLGRSEKNKIFFEVLKSVIGPEQYDRVFDVYKNTLEQREHKLKPSTLDALKRMQGR